MPRVIATWNGYAAERPANYKSLTFHLLTSIPLLPFRNLYTKEARLRKGVEGYKTLIYFLVSNGPENVSEERKRAHVARIEENLQLLKEAELALLAHSIGNVRTLLDNSSAQPQSALQAWEKLHRQNQGH